MSQDGLPDEFSEEDLNALLLNREYIKSALSRLKPKAMRQVRHALNRLREGRRVGGAAAAQRPEETTDEVYGELMWQVTTLPPGDTKAIAQMVRDLLALREGVSGQDNR